MRLGPAQCGRLVLAHDNGLVTAMTDDAELTRRREILQKARALLADKARAAALLRDAAERREFNFLSDVEARHATEQPVEAPPENVANRNILSMDAATSEAWTTWAQGLIRQALISYDEEAREQLMELIDALGDRFTEVANENKRLGAELSALRADHTVVSALVRGEISQLKAKTDAA
jgi:hypothetical protein